MGIYLNPGNQVFSRIVNSGEYVDKSGLLRYTNSLCDGVKPYLASIRPRRFGKSMAASMVSAYYGRGCDSRPIFEGLEIAGDLSFDRHLNKYDVISLDIQEMRSWYLQEKDRGSMTPLDYIRGKVLAELREAYPEQVGDGVSHVADALALVNQATGSQFVVVIDEWDCFFREDKDDVRLIGDYITFLRSLFKGRQSDQFIKLAYITGILPIKKYGTQSALNNFRELTMIAPGAIAEYVGFTEKEVRSLCKQHKMSFAEMRRWYDGYYLDKIGHVYSPNSVMEAIDNDDFQNYWSRTETYESLKMYIEMDFDGLRQKVIDMLGGGRCKIITQAFQNDMTTFNSADDVLTLLVHLGYLAYDGKTKEVFIPNEEVRDTFVLSVMDKGWGDVFKAIQESEKLLAATLAMDEEMVAAMVQDAHMRNSSSLVYNNEISLASVIRVAYYSAAKDYTLVRELPSGEGFADMAFVPRRRSKKPAMLVELKWDKSAEGALDQIKAKKYSAALKEYEGNILLVGIGYDKADKKHHCKIERA